MKVTRYPRYSLCFAFHAGLDLGLVHARVRRELGGRTRFSSKRNLPPSPLVPFHTFTRKSVAQASRAICEMLAKNVGIVRKVRREGRRTQAAQPYTGT